MIILSVGLQLFLFKHKQFEMQNRHGLSRLQGMLRRTGSTPWGSMVVIKNYNVIYSSKIKDKGDMKVMYKNRMDLLMFGSTGIFFFPL